MSKLSTSRNDGQGGKGVTMTPSSGEYERVVLWFHGLGDQADGWSELMPALDMEKTKFILPSASPRPIALNGGASMPGWSNIYGLDASSQEDKEGFTSSAERVNALIQSEIDVGIAPHNICVGGFSQGGALALHVSLRSAHQLGCCVALSTWLPFRDEYPTALPATLNKAMPVLQVHGSADQVVAHKWGQGSSELLKTMLTNHEFITIKVCTHANDLGSDIYP